MDAEAFFKFIGKTPEEILSSLTALRKSGVEPTAILIPEFLLLGIPVKTDSKVRAVTISTAEGQ